MKILKPFFFLTLVFFVASCYEQEEWLDKNVTYTNKAVPSIYLYPLDSTSFIRGGRVRMLLEFWCNDPMKEIRIYQSTGATSTTTPRTLVKTEAYKPAYSLLRQQDTLVTFVDVPANLAASTRVWLYAEGVSQKDVAYGTWLLPTSLRSYTAR